MTESSKEIELKDRFLMNETETEDSAKLFSIGAVTNEIPKQHVESDLVQMNEDQSVDDTKHGNESHVSLQDFRLRNLARQ
jgi:hypothetical protein